MPIPNPYSVGDKVLASRAQDGENHEEAEVVDAYSLLIGPEEIPIVAVKYPDGERATLRSLEGDVLPWPEEDDEADVDESGESESDEHDEDDVDSDDEDDS